MNVLVGNILEDVSIKNWKYIIMRKNKKLSFNDIPNRSFSNEGAPAVSRGTITLKGNANNAQKNLLISLDLRNDSICAVVRASKTL